ncbi:MAG TPA: hypothetical protein VJT15_06810 [Pyrinomonadaceae bacterium]|nr:hypothetical protein [Pyrinomonadaceae bacterium]
MRSVKKTFPVTAGLCLLFLTLLPVGKSFAQKLPKAIFIQGTAMGQNQQSGRMFSINVHIDELSTADDQQALLEAFNAKGNEGLVNALSRMKSKGRIAITGTLGYDVNYIRSFKQPDGTTLIRLVTDRPITFGEAWHDTRSSDYNLSGLEIVLSPDKKKNSGTLLPACQFKIDKENHLEIEAYQNPWKLVNIMRR